MATTTAAPAPSLAETSTEGDPVNLAELSSALYEKCRSEFAPETFFYQADLEKLNIIPNRNVDLLRDCTNFLVDQRLFRLLQDSEQRVGWKVVPRDIANNFKSLSAEEALIYSAIQSTSKAGIWTKNIKMRTGLAQTTVTQCLKKLENRNYIKQVKDVRYPSRKTYMLFNLQPTENVTGGAWFTDGVLDSELIRVTSLEIQKYVARQSFQEITSLKRSASDKADGQERKRQKSSHTHRDREREQPSSSLHPPFSTAKTLSTPAPSSSTTTIATDIKPDADLSLRSRESLSPSSARRPPKKEYTIKTYLPYPAGYIAYPTLQSITTAINDAGFAKIPFTEEAIAQLLDTLVWDYKLIRIEPPPETDYQTMYRSPLTIEAVVRQFERERRAEGDDVKGERKRDYWLEEWERNGMTEAPCGRCPVFDLCEDGGPVNAKNCEYFEKWLNF